MRFQMEKLTENTVRDDNVLVYKSADISDADLLIRIYNSALYDDFIRYGQCQAYGQSREEMEKSVKVFPKIIAFTRRTSLSELSLIKLKVRESIILAVWQ